MKKSFFQNNFPLCALLLSCMVWACNKEDQKPITPRGVIFKSWSIEHIPDTSSNGKLWDFHDNTGPDLKLVLSANGAILYESEIIADAVSGSRYEIDIEPDIRIDSIWKGEWELQDELEPFFDFDIIKWGFVSASNYYPYTSSQVGLWGINPKIDLQVEYIY